MTNAYKHKRRNGNNGSGATVVQEVEKLFSNQKVVSSIPCRSVLEQDTEPLIAPDVHCAISVNVKMSIHPCKCSESEGFVSDADVQARLDLVKPGRGCFLIFSGFDGTAEEL